MTASYKSHIQSLFKDNEVHRIFGPAGTGKTTFLVSELKTLLNEGINPERIAFVSFTNRAVDELVERCTKEFPHVLKESFKFFRTIHSLCYRVMNSNKKVITQTELSKFAKSRGLDVSSYKSIEEGGGKKKGDKVMTIEHLSRLRMVDIRTQWEDCNFVDVPFYTASNWRFYYNHHKKSNNLIDFTDMLEAFDSQLDVDYVFIDECQDLSPLQWDVMSKASANCKKVYIAGDDDQSIYAWAGAEVEYILGIPADDETTLPKSYRLPKNIYKYSSKILKRIKVRKDKKYTHNGSAGIVDHVFDFKAVNYADLSDGLLLARNRWQLKEVKEYLEEQGHPYFLFSNSSLECAEVEAILMWEHLRKGKELAPRQFKKLCKFSKQLNKLVSASQIPYDFYKLPWFDVLDLIPREKQNYFRRVMGNGHKLNDKPKIKLSTIHQSKGGEADTVILLTDVSKSVMDDIWKDNEHRVWYVAVTRAKNKLIIVQEQGTQYYKI